MNDSRSLDDQIDDVSAELVELRVQAEELAAGEREDEPSTELVRVGSSAEAARAQMHALRSRATHAQREIEEKQKELQRLVREKKDALDQMARDASAALEPIEKMVEVLKEGIWTVNLYLGTEEQIKVVREGSPAPAETPITVRQMVLYMDEECAVFGTDNQGLNAGNIGWFDTWVKKPEHLQQILPEERGVVAMKPRRYARHERRHDEDHATYFLIRNGQRLYRLWTKFEVGETLIPRANEWTRLFEEDVSGRGESARRRPLQPGTRKWEKAQERAQQQERHYMRVALILQGLVDRTTVFRPMPEHWLDGGLFLDREHHEREHVRFLMDMDNAIGTGREPFRSWQKRTNAELRVGMRIIGSFRRNAGFDRHEYQHSYGNSRLHPTTAEKPQDGMIYTVEDRQGAYYIIRYHRTQEVWDPDGWRESPDRPGWGWKGEHRTAKVRASCKLLPDDTFFVCFDEMSIDDARGWLLSRTDRHEYEEMFPVLKAAISGKEYEWAAEAPLRQMVAGLLVRENGSTVEDAEREAPDLIEWAKKKNRIHRTLVAGEDPALANDPQTGNAEGAKIIQQIVREHARRVKDRKRPVKREHLDRLHREHPDAIVIARRADARYVVLTPQQEGTPFVKVHEHYARDARLAETQEWRLPGARLNSMTILYSTEAWEKWNRQATLGAYLTGPEIAEGAERILKMYEGDRVASIRYEQRERSWTVYVLDEPAKVDDLRMLTGTQKDVALTVMRHHWRRGVGMRVELSPKPRYAGSTVTWPRAWQGEPAKRPAFASKSALWRNDAVIAEAEREHARYMAGQDVRERLDKVAEEAVKSIRVQWVKDRWDDAYRRFMTEYGDSSLWEGHKKTLKEPNWPHGGSYAREDKSFGFLVKRLVERGVSLDGKTVAEAAELGKQHGVDKFKPPKDIAQLAFSYKVPEEADIGGDGTFTFELKWRSPVDLPDEDEDEWFDHAVEDDEDPDEPDDEDDLLLDDDEEDEDEDDA